MSDWPPKSEIISDLISGRRERSRSHFILTSERNGLVIHRDQVRFLRCAGRYVYQGRYYTFLLEGPTPISEAWSGLITNLGRCHFCIRKWSSLPLWSG